MKNQGFIARTSIGSYIALPGIFYGIGFFFIIASMVVGMDDPRELMKIASLMVLAGVLFTVWLSGFKLEISQGTLTYRDGFFREKKISLSEIKSLKNASISFNYFGKKMSVPRMLIIPKDSYVKRIEINIKPFPRNELMKFKDLIKLHFK